MWDTSPCSYDTQRPLSVLKLSRPDNVFTKFPGTVKAAVQRVMQFSQCAHVCTLLCLAWPVFLCAGFSWLQSTSHWCVDEIRGAVCGLHGRRSDALTLSCNPERKAKHRKKCCVSCSSSSAVDRCSNLRSFVNKWEATVGGTNAGKSTWCWRTNKPQDIYSSGRRQTYQYPYRETTTGWFQMAHEI